MQNDVAAMEDCAKACHDCLDACLVTIPHCLDLGGAHASRAHQTLLADCAAICAVAHSLLHRQSPQHAHTCRACAEICGACADDCDRLDDGNAVMRNCARMCRRCADSCERMAGSHA